MAFNVEGALKDGYSRAEIADYLASKNKFDAESARKDNYSDDEIIAGADVTPKRNFNEDDESDDSHPPI